MPHLDARKLGVLGVAIAAIYAHCHHRNEPATATHTPAADPASARARTSHADRATRIRERGARGAVTGVGDGGLAGVTVDESGRPIAAATVTLDGQRTTVTEDDGSFAFPDVAQGPVRLTAEHGARYGELAITFDDSGSVARITLHVGPRVTIRVVDAGRTPIAGATVSPSTGMDAVTGHDGKAVFRNLGHSDEYIVIVAPGHASQMIVVDLGGDPRRAVDQTVVLAPNVPIGGVVVDQDGKPVVGAAVVARATGVPVAWRDTTTTDAEGHWRLDGFAAGKLRLVASNGVDPMLPDLLVELGDAPRLDLVVRIVHRASATIGGIVVDPAGKPLAGVHVSVGEGADSDEQGRFLIEGIAPGKTEVQAASSTQLAPMQTIDVPPGGHVELRFEMVASSIAGIVTNLRGEPVAGACVTADGPARTLTYTDDSGAFDFKAMAPGDYHVSVTRDSAADHTLLLSEQHATTVHTGDRQVALVLPDASTITGRVILDGKPVDYFGVAVETDELRPTPDPQLATTGRFEIQVQVNSEWPEQRSISIVGPGFQRRVIAGVLVSPGQTTDLGDLVVSAGRTVHGRVVDRSGAPIPDAVVVVQVGDRLETGASLHNENNSSRGARCDASGQFEIAGLPDDLTDLEIQAQHPARGLALPRALTAADLGDDVELVIEATGAVVISVADDPEASHWIRVVSSRDGRRYGDLMSDGELAIAQLPPGDYTVSYDLDPPGSAPPPVAFHIEANQTTAVVLASPAR